MKWIVLAIVLAIGPYTYLTLHFRKPGPAYLPYEDTKRRVTTGRLLSTGFQRINLEVERPADALHFAPPADLVSAPGGLPAVLADAIVDQPVLPVSIDQVGAAGSMVSTRSYTIQFTCSLTDNHEQLAGSQLFRRDGEIYIVPSFEKLDSGLLARTRDSSILLTVPAGLLKPGHYAVRLVGARSSRQWTLQVH